MRKNLLGNELQIIFTMIGDSIFGIDIQNIVSVFDYTGGRVVPFAPKYMNSIMNFQGKILTIFDLKSYFDYEENTPSAGKKVIYLKHPKLRTGILVDRIVNIDYVLQSCVESLPENGVHSAEAEFCKGVFVFKEDVFGGYWLDTDKTHEFVGNCNML